ncbi:hypothetical protein SEA_COMRADE_13 [Streptomyces phage Comrade]|uniref:Uncharacterized protein n=3 Tax=Gilsonvirus comrade TaxID=2846395 RepID=A0A345MDV0_9CAUD|nr:hypothetical protein HWB84_gp013 [Streptomyces phage Comrade]AXH68731.1 hypothetical protein SEA_SPARKLEGODDESS_13 [Streptomyces phage SparkleGoddess]QQO39703.1 hypothetical protein SEA_BELFORT_15 [Streptomyces phage Belfort]QZE11613.1 hypothetical protein SEA_KARP_13 [Streptomyces phage Karp]UTN92272.1 hypothetical protein SEA_STIGMA_13 [Streptomyces phage Stigma]AXQ63290.1 hypothetical protein SEA_COMRADE_13 [Streptomyces phage Comrade]
MEWSIFHNYRHLADEGKVKHLQCPDCGHNLTTRLGQDDEPTLWCAICDSTIRPGLDLYDRIRAVVSEHNA